MKHVIDNMISDDWEAVRTVYEEGIATGHSTFEANSPGWENWDADHLAQPRLVARQGNALLGWAALTPVSRRPVYAGVGEVSLYVGRRYRGKSIGSALLAALIEASEQEGLWTLQGGIFPENRASRALVRKHGFREVGRREGVGKMIYGELAGKWRDVVLVERRSRVVGVD